jgi:hypothetical protein
LRSKIGQNGDIKRIFFGGASRQRIFSLPASFDENHLGH